MKTRTTCFAVSIAILLLAACGRNSYEENAKAEYDDITPSAIGDSTASGGAEDYISSSAAVLNKKDTTRKFIRTADLKFKVKDVVRTTYQIEDIAAKFDGFVTYTRLNSHIDNKITVPVSADSSLETTFFIVENTMTLRVPNTQLDTTLKCIARLVNFLDHRIITANDVRLNLLGNRLTQLRVNKHETRLEKAIDERGKKLHETTAAEEKLIDRQEQADNAKVSNLSLQDQVDFSTINLSIYQRQDIRRELVCNYRNIETYEPGFGTQLGESFKFGWNIVKGFCLFLAKIWAIILIGIILFIVFKRYGDRQTKK